MWPFPKKSKPSTTEQAKINPPKPVPVAPKSASTEFIEVLGQARRVDQILYVVAVMMHKHGPITVKPEGAECWSNSAQQFMPKYEVVFADGSSVVIKLP